MEEKENNECNNDNFFVESVLFVTLLAMVITKESKKVLEKLGKEVCEKLNEKLKGDGN